MFAKSICWKSFLNRSLKHHQNYSIPTANQDNLIVKHLKDDYKGITVISLNRPKEKNSFNTSLMTNFHNALTNITQDENVRVVVLRSEVPNIFCAGADLKERLTMPVNLVNKFVTSLRELMFRVYNLPVPTITALDGLALGGGMELALSTDIRIGAKNSKMGLVETKLAIIPGAGGTQYLPRLINPAIAKELIFTSKILTSSEALELGILNHNVEQNDNGNAAYLKALETAKEILPNGPVAIKMAKVAINRGVEVDLHTGLNIEQACYGQLIPTNDRIEGLNAFKEKRKPQYQGN